MKAVNPSKFYINHFDVDSIFITGKEATHCTVLIEPFSTLQEKYLKNFFLCDKVATHLGVVGWLQAW